MGDSARPWTAEILYAGMTLYAAVAKSTKYGTFATENRDHARMFRTQLEVEEWIERLAAPNATAVNLNNPSSRPAISNGIKRATKAKVAARN